MNGIAPLKLEAVTGKTQVLLAAVRSKTGRLPNTFGILGNSTAALEGYLQFNAALAGGTLGMKVREQISLAVAEENECGYCLSAHTFYAAEAGLTEEDIANARHSVATVEKVDAVLKLTDSLLSKRGKVTDAELQTARAAGVTDGEIIEIIGNVALNTFTNYLNLVAKPVVDFPEVEPDKSKYGGASCGCAAPGSRQ
jgi:uncharacterized peroxidase-related enzyme